MIYVPDETISKVRLMSEEEWYAMNDSGANELAEKLNGCLERDEVSKEVEQIAKENGLVIVFGASDDLMIFRGAIDDELCAYEGATAYIDSLGLIVNRCDDDNCPYYIEKLGSATEIKAVWCITKDYAWTFETSIPHETFDVIDPNDQEQCYCKGIVFKLSDVE